MRGLSKFGSAEASPGGSEGVAGRGVPYATGNINKVASGRAEASAFRRFRPFRA